MEKYLQVGAITQTHGLKGEVKVYPTTDDPARFRQLKQVIVDTGKARTELEIEGVRFFKNMVIVKFKGIDDINDVEQYRKATLWVSRENALPLEENENYIADLIGMKVATDEGEELGELTAVMQTAANDIYVVNTRAYGELMIPAIRQCILEVNVEASTMLVHLLPGLKELG